MKKDIIFKRLAFSLLALVLALVAGGASAVEVYPGDVTTGPPEVLFDISIQPLFGGGSSTTFIILLSVGIIVLLGIIYFVLRARKKKMLQKISQINETK